ncbi:hypothetical protein ACNKHU_23350 [Shigella flexneri]
MWPFCRRAFNVEGILCLPNSSSNEEAVSGYWSMTEQPRLEQMISQMDKLEDVVKVQRNHPIRQCLRLNRSAR